MKFKSKYPELNENQIKQLKRELLDLIEPEETMHKWSVFYDHAVIRNATKIKVRKAIVEYFK